MIKRRPVDKEVASDILFMCDRTCCVCRMKGKEVQIHHIDENPGNGARENLAVLCFDCHNLTQISGGFGRKLDALQVSKYWNDWIETIERSRRNAERILTKSIELSTARPPSNLDSLTPNEERILKYIWALPEVRIAAWQLCEAGASTGITSDVTQAFHDYAEVLRLMLLRLLDEK